MLITFPSVFFSSDLPLQRTTHYIDQVSSTVGSTVILKMHQCGCLNLFVKQWKVLSVETLMADVVHSNLLSLTMLKVPVSPIPAEQRLLMSAPLTKPTVNSLAWQMQPHWWLNSLMKTFTKIHPLCSSAQVEHTVCVTHHSTHHTVRPSTCGSECVSVFLLSMKNEFPIRIV